ncbi:tail fiber protein [Escherichia coli]|uniref:tail fiber protein n=1 Tax=Escherichia coli TaxID=562 RepID=UPI0040691B61
MIDVSDRIDLTIGIEISDSVTSTRSDVAASSLAVKKSLRSGEKQVYGAGCKHNAKGISSAQ